MSAEILREQKELRAERAAQEDDLKLLRQLCQQGVAGTTGSILEDNLGDARRTLEDVRAKLERLSEESQERPAAPRDLVDVVTGVGSAMRKVGKTWGQVSRLCRHLKVDAGEGRHRTWEGVADVEGGGLADKLREVWASRGQQDFHTLKTFVFDCDGVLWNVADPEKAPASGDTPDSQEQAMQARIMPRVNELLRDDSKRVLFVTNNSHSTREAFIKRLAECGVDFGELTDQSNLDRCARNMVTASFTTAKLLKQKGVKRPLVLTSTVGLLEELKLVGITDFITTYDESSGKQKAEYMREFNKANIEDLMEAHQDVDAVVMGWDFHLTTLKVGLAANILRWSMDVRGDKHIPLFTCSSDSSGVLGTSKSGEELRAVGNGAMGTTIASCFDPMLPQIFCGKPSDALLKLMQEPEAGGGYGVDPSTAVMIGDAIETDIEFANKCGMRSLFVLSGVNSMRDMQHSGDPRRWATWVLPSFADV